MLAQWIAYPTKSLGPKSVRIMVPAVGTKYDSSNESVFFSDSAPSSIGNRSCLHFKVSWNVVPITPKYKVTDYSMAAYPFVIYSTIGLPLSQWSSLVANVLRKRVYRVDYGTSVTEKYLTVDSVAPGRARAVCESIVTYPNPKNNIHQIVTLEFSIGGITDTNCTVKETTRTLMSGSWQETTSITRCPCGRTSDLEVDPFSADARILWRKHGKEFLARASTTLPLREWGELSEDCITQGDKAYQTNSLQYLLELGQISTLLNPYLGLIRGGLSAQKAASAWLSYYYGARLTVKDTYAQISGIVKRSQRGIMAYDSMHSRDQKQLTLPGGTTLSGYRVLTTYYRTHTTWILDTWRAMRRYGLNPSLSLAWDLVPLSFVVDWLTPIGDALAHFDGHTFQQSLSIIESLLTTKYEQTASAASMGYPSRLGTITFSYYDRHVARGHMPKAVFKPDPISFSGMKLLNGASLVVQRRH